ncbi:hypothetical protein [Streptomyces tsukubensis]|uniref:Uncharacterized protein n=1 Tax=Streptomyces tsukubensis TaxID=83656 RepID=A0A1V4A0Z5_9ACTN|nr:hypothetical protein [Streptomyces tsukubensis]OON71889.1 hypothetical protein B1H18_32055 [Streptomyces tsukubensis]QFR91842.1 hypothetical protein GBW32_00740 [Streptomyces tsukubensis]
MSLIGSRPRRTRTRSLRASVLLVTGGLSFGVSGVPAQADPPEHPSIALVEQLAGEPGLIPSVRTDPPGSRAVDQDQPTVPAEAWGSLFGSRGAEGIGLGLPGRHDAPRAVVGKRGTVLYSDAADSADLVVQYSAPDSARTLMVLKSKAAPRQYRFPLTLPAHTEVVPDGDGGLAIGTVNPDGVLITQAEIEAPWAKDADGKDVRTRLTVEGNDIVQTVVPTPTTRFPVVADPKITWGIVTGTAYFSRAETRRIAIYGATAALSTTLLPPPLNALYAANAALVGSKAVAANAAKRCLKIKFAAGLFIPDAYKGGYCR